jgi:Cd2+/Zn2+-exporting ATPase
LKRPMDSEKNRLIEEDCLVHSVAAALAREPGIEAVTLNRRDKSISVATLGRNQEPVAERVANELRRFAEPADQDHCPLLLGDDNCDRCGRALPAMHRENLSIKSTPDSTTIARLTCPTSPKFWHWKNFPWPRIAPREMEQFESEEELEEWKGQLVAAGLCGVFGVAGALAPLPWLRLALFVCSYVAGAWFAAEDVWKLLRERKLDVHFLMLAVAFGSAFINAWAEGATLLFLFSFAGGLEHYAMGRTHREIRALFKSAPKTAVLLDDHDRERESPVEELRPGDRILIRPDSQFPVDGDVISGGSAADESALTGESVPVEKKMGDAVFAGTLNLSGSVQVRVTKLASQSALQRIIQLIRDAQHLKAPTQRFTDKFGTNYTYGILALAVVMFFVWWLGLGLKPFSRDASHSSAFYRAMVLLVVASPCALVLSIPSAVLAAIAWGARRGVLFRGGAPVENLAGISVVAMDKTGTLTTGELQVARIESFPPGREGEILNRAYALENLSTHPLARAIARHAKRQCLRVENVDSFDSAAGLGVKGEIRGRFTWAGKRDWVFQETKTPAMPLETGAGLSEVWIGDGELLGRILLRDDPRPQAAVTVALLRQAGLRTVVLTGDRASAAEALNQTVKVDEVRAELKPADKLRLIQELHAKGERVAMIGDGVNDAPSLAAADVGVAMGARGSDAALEQADVVLTHDKLENFWIAYQLSRRARAVIRQNLVISLGTVVVLVVFAVSGKIPLTLGVLGHEGSTVVVVANSLRLLLRR